jgi:hypothetical protein
MSTSRSGPTEGGPVPSLKFRGWFREFLRAGEQETASELLWDCKNASRGVTPVGVPVSQELSRNHSKTPQERLL